MKLSMKSPVKSLALTLACCTSLSVMAEEQKFLAIGTGGQTGVYYVVGQSICRMVNRNTDEHHIRCTAPSTGGSIANINAIRAGDLDMGVAQSDWQYHALHGTSKFSEAGAYPELRSVFSVHSEPFNVVARTDSGIKDFSDLPGKRVNIGNPGSGQRGTMELLMAERGWTKDTFALASELKSSEQSQALCDNKIDAFVITAGHPVAYIKEASTSCDSIMIPVTGADVDKLIEESSYYAAATIPGGMYRGTNQDTSTFGVLATFVSSAAVEDEVVYALVKSVFGNFDRFKKLHPAFAHLDPQKMVTDGLSAPLHDGAAKYFREQGWIE